MGLSLSVHIHFFSNMTISWNKYQIRSTWARNVGQLKSHSNVYSFIIRHAWQRGDCLCVSVCRVYVCVWMYVYMCVCVCVWVHSCTFVHREGDGGDGGRFVSLDVCDWRAETGSLFECMCCSTHARVSVCVCASVMCVCSEFIWFKILYEAGNKGLILKEAIYYKCRQFA